MSEWQKDIRPIMDIINIAKDDNTLDVEVESDVAVSIPELKVKIARSTQASNTFEFCETCQEIVDRMRATGHNVNTFMRYLRQGSPYTKGNWMDNPIEYGYNTNITISSFEVIISDHPKKSRIKRFFDKFKKKDEEDEKV